MTVPFFLAYLLFSLVIGHGAGLLAFMLYHRRGIRAAVCAAIGVAAFVGVGFLYNAAMVGLPLLKWLEMQRPQLLVLSVTATPTFVGTFAFWHWYTKRNEPDAAVRKD